MEVPYNYSGQDIRDVVAGHWSGRYPGGRMPAFDVDITISVEDDAEVLYGFPLIDDPDSDLIDEAREDCAAVILTADVEISHEEVPGVSFDLFSSRVVVHGFNLGSSVSDDDASTAGWPPGIPGTEVQNTTEEPYQEGDDDEVRFLFSPDETLWILERQPPHQESGHKTE